MSHLSAEVFEVFFQRATIGDAEAQYEIGLHFLRIGEPEDLIIAVRYIQQAVEQHYARAQNRLGLMYLEGYGVEKNDALAVALFQKAADQGNMGAFFNLAVMLENGLGMDKPDLVSAALYYQDAADLGCTDSLYNLALMFEQARGVSKNEEMAFILYSYAAKLGDKVSQESLNWIQMNDITHQLTDFKEKLNLVDDDNVYNALDSLFQSLIRARDEYIDTCGLTVTSEIAKALFREKYTSAVFQTLRGIEESWRPYLYSLLNNSEYTYVQDDFKLSASGLNLFSFSDLSITPSTAAAAALPTSMDM